MRPFAGIVAVGLLTTAGGLMTTGCGDDSESLGPEEIVEEEPVGFTTPDEAIAGVAAAWEGLDLQAMEEVLASDFKFHIRDDEAADFPWLATPWWGRAEELGFAANMFDPNFTGENPPVQSIEFQYNVLASNESQPGTHDVTIDATITVLTGPADGWRADTRFLLKVTEQPDGFFLLSEMKEVLKLDPAGRGASSSMESSTWGQIKGLYR